jgi:hypothetical protein
MLTQDRGKINIVIILLDKSKKGVEAALSKEIA